MKPSYDDFMSTLQSELQTYDPFWLAREFTRLEKQSTAKFLKDQEEQMELCKRVGEQLDAVPRMLVQLVTEGAP